MNIKTSHLTGSALDWAVAIVFNPGDEWGYWSPSTNWSQGGLIIDLEKIKVAPNLNGTWHGQIRHTKDHPLSKHPILSGWTNQHGPTPLIAAMRAYVASKMGDAVEVPEEFA